ncbi:MAG: cyclic nucleotide-binding domain-containing protein [Oceanococcus sp.]
MLTKELVKSIYPLNKLSEDALHRLSENARKQHLRANRQLFKIGDSPIHCYYLLEGMLELIDQSRDRFETVTPVDGGESLPLPSMLPAMQNCRSLVDSTVLCVDRVILADILKTEGAAVEDTLGDSVDPYVWNTSEADLVKEFMAARREQQGRLESQGIVVQDDPVIAALTGNTSEKENDASESMERSQVEGKANRQLPLVEQALAFKPNSRVPVVSTGNLDVPLQFRDQITRKQDIQGPLNQSEALKPSQSSPIPMKAALKVFSSADGLTQLPESILMRCFLRCEAVEFKAGDRIIKQGCKGDYWFLVVSGGCDVRFSHLNKSIELNYHGPGSSFGEDSLISGKPRNAHVYARVDSTLLRLKRDDFCTLLMPFLSRSISFEAAQCEELKEALWIDVRMPKEKSGAGIANSVEIPFPVIRAQFFMGDIKRKIIVVCRNGTDSPVIAYMLRRQGFDASYLENGFEAIPLEQQVSRHTNQPQTESGVVRRQ